MKARIVKYTKYNSCWYEVQYKRFLFWHTLKDAYGCEYIYTAEDIARERCIELLSRSKRTITATFED